MGLDCAGGDGEDRRPYTIHPRRWIVDAILYMDRSGCAWRMMPHDFPPWDTVHWYFQRGNADGTTYQIHDSLRAAVRDAAGRDPMASTGIVDAQSFKGAGTVGPGSRSYDAGKRVNGRKCHIVVNTLGPLDVVMITAASVQDPNGGRLVLEKARMKTPPRTGLGRWRLRRHALDFVRRFLHLARETSGSPRGNTLSNCCRATGSSNASCPGWCAAAAWTRTTNGCRPMPRPWSSGP
ncbi:transposase [Glutamicibacter sp. NPDC087344]|uniref:transposase n=1 Tax=Glutamicibacter sp. NPDC087344 TaxID=3363994 RepID=UPI003820BBD5